jgi:WD40 repeat protein
MKVFPLWLSAAGLIGAGSVLAGAGSAPQRLPVPDQEARARVEALVRDLFKEDLATKEPATRSRLATELLRQARESKEEPAARYVLYHTAAELAAQAGGAALALAAAEELARQFDVNALDLKSDLVDAVGKVITSPEANQALVDVTLALVNEALDADQYAAASRLGKVAEEAARRSRNVPLLAAVRKRNEEVRTVEKGFSQLKPFLDRLKHSAEDPEANLKLGEYYGLLKGKWLKALPFLARGGGPGLRAQARKDLACPKEAREQLAVADGWWELSASHQDPARLHLQLRAAYWYEKAAGELRGLHRTKAVRRTEQVAARARGSETAPAGTPVGELRKFEGHADEVKGVAFAPDGRYGLSGSVDTTMRLWDLATGKEMRVFKGHTKQVWGVAYHPNGRQIVSTSWDATARLWEAATGQEVRRYQHPIDVNGVALTRDGKWMLTGCDDHDVRLWDVGTGQELRRFSGHARFVYGVAFSPDGRHLASGGVDQTVRIFDLTTGNEVRKLEGYTSAVTTVAYSPDGRYLFSCGDSAARMWDAGTGKEVRRFEGTTGQIGALALSADGRRLLTGSDDKTVRLWDVGTGKEVHRFDGHTDTVSCVAFAPDGRRALSGSLDRTVRLWGLPAR